MLRVVSVRGAERFGRSVKRALRRRGGIGGVGERRDLAHAPEEHERFHG